MTTQSTSLARVRFIEQRGKRILLIDFSGLQATEEILAEVENARALSGAAPPRYSVQAVSE